MKVSFRTYIVYIKRENIIFLSSLITNSLLSGPRNSKDSLNILIDYEYIYLVRKKKKIHTLFIYIYICIYYSKYLYIYLYIISYKQIFFIYYIYKCC